MPSTDAAATGHRAARRARADVTLVPFGDEVVVLDASAGRAHRLNHTAAAILDACDGTRSDQEVVGEVARAFGVEAGAVELEVVSALAALDEAGLFDRPPPSAAGPDHRPTERGEPVPPDPSGARTLGPYRAGPARFEVVAAGAAADEAARFLAPLAVALDARDGGPTRDVDGDGTHRYVLAPVDGGHVLAVDGRVLDHFGDDAAALAYLEWHLNRRVIEGTIGRVALHAAGLGDGTSVVALPAAMDAGKSTLAVALVRSGLDYVTDEALCLRPADLTAEPYPKALTLEPGSFPLFPDLAEAAGAVDARFASRRWRLTPDEIRPGARVVGGRLVAVVSPQYVGGASIEEHELAPIDAFLLLLEQSFPCTFADRRALDALVGIARDVPCTRLVHGGGPEAVDAVTARFRAAATAT